MTKHYFFIAATVVLVTCLSNTAVRADSVTLTSGTASTLSGIGTANLLGNSFSLRYTGEIPFGATNAFTINSVTLALGIPNVTFNGVQSQFFSGALTFSNSLLTGNVTAYATMEDLFLGRSPLFTVDFSGAGFVTITQTPGGTETRFTVAVPEPATLILLGTALFGGAAFKRRRRKLLDEPASSVEADD